MQQTDETYVKVAGRWVYLYRAVDQYGQVIDVYASARRDSEAARRFFDRARKATGVVPVEVITDRAPTYSRVLDELWPTAWHQRGQDRAIGPAQSGTPTIGSRPTTRSSNGGYVRCAGSRP
jgi:transposase-like protein